MYLVDTPGVLPPRLGDVEMGMKLALCGEVVARGSPQTWPLGYSQPLGVRGWKEGWPGPSRVREAGASLPGAIRDHLVGEDIMADYLLYTLNKQQQFG